MDSIENFITFLNDNKHNIYDKMNLNDCLCEVCYDLKHEGPMKCFHSIITHSDIYCTSKHKHSKYDSDINENTNIDEIKSFYSKIIYDICKLMFELFQYDEFDKYLRLIGPHYSNIRHDYDQTPEYYLYNIYYQLTIDKLRYYFVDDRQLDKFDRLVKDHFNWLRINKPEHVEYIISEIARYSHFNREGLIVLINNGFDIETFAKHNESNITTYYFNELFDGRSKVSECSSPEMSRETTAGYFCQIIDFLLSKNIPIEKDKLVDLKRDKYTALQKKLLTYLQ